MLLKNRFWINPIHIHRIFIFYSSVFVTVIKYLCVNIWFTFFLNCRWLLSQQVYKQEFNCNLVGYYGAVEKTFDLFRPVFTFAVLLLFYFVYLCFILVYLCWLHNWHLCFYVKRYTNNYWFITIFSIVCPYLGALAFPDCMWTNKWVDMKSDMNISINVISQFWFLIAYHRCYKVFVQTCEVHVTQVLYNAGYWSLVLQRDFAK